MEEETLMVKIWIGKKQPIKLLEVFVWWKFNNINKRYW